MLKVSSMPAPSRTTDDINIGSPKSGLKLYSPHNQSAEEIRNRGVSASPRYSNDALKEMRKGTSLLKYGARGKPKFRFFQLTKDNSALKWFSDKKKLHDTTINIKDISKIAEHSEHEKNKKEGFQEMAESSFTIDYKHNKKECQLRLTCKNDEEYTIWAKGLMILHKWVQDGNDPSKKKDIFIKDDKESKLKSKKRRETLAKALGRSASGTFISSRKFGGGRDPQKEIKKIRAEVKKLRTEYD
eukprot:UN32786